jgi:lipoprotein-anchoring transpeptidase ErfK/SrfK
MTTAELKYSEHSSLATHKLGDEVKTMNNRIEVNLTTRRLSYFEGDQLVKEYSVGVGKPSTPTPIGHHYIIKKIADQQDIPAGLGTRWMHLSVGNSCIHGTNDDNSVEGYVSGGCIRMHNEDIEELFEKVATNTPVIVTE